MRRPWIALMTLVPLSIGRAAGQTPAEGPEFPVNTYTTGSQNSPSVAMSPTGDSVVTWRSVGQVGTGPAIFGRRFDVFGQPLGGEFQVNTYSAGTYGYSGPSVSMDSSGNFVVVWESGNDGSGSGIAGQRFDSAGVARAANSR